MDRWLDSWYGRYEFTNMYLKDVEKLSGVSECATITDNSLNESNTHLCSVADTEPRSVDKLTQSEGESV